MTAHVLISGKYYLYKALRLQLPSNSFVQALHAGYTYPKKHQHYS